MYSKFGSRALLLLTVFALLPLGSDGLRAAEPQIANGVKVEKVDFHFGIGGLGGGFYFRPYYYPYYNYYYYPYYYYPYRYNYYYW